VIARAVTLAVRTNAPDTKNVDAALSDAINRWRTLDLPLFWEAVVAYCNAIKANFAEQVMLLTYLQTILPPEPPATTSGAGMDPAYAADLICALNEVVAKALATGNPNDIYATCGQLTLRGDDVSNAFATRVALLAMATLAAGK
jgi:hypothetical protein